jgi:hypothetical protein
LVQTAQGRTLTCAVSEIQRTTWGACSDACASGSPKTWYAARTTKEGSANAGAEIRQGQAMQALQLHTRRVFQGRQSSGDAWIGSDPRSAIGRSKIPTPHSRHPARHRRVPPTASRVMARPGPSPFPTLPNKHHTTPRCPHFTSTAPRRASPHEATIS